MVNIEPLGDRVIVRPDEAEKISRGGVHLAPERNKMDRPHRATVVAVGSGYRRPDGTYEPLDLSPGDRVFVPTYSGTDFHHNHERLWSYRIADILAKIVE